MEKRYANPVIVQSKDKIHQLQRFPLMKPPFSEEELQELLRTNPEILPIDLVADERFSPLICIGREVNIGNGCIIDNLYISPKGYLTLIETKLWKNTEARREVIAQVIEYANQLSKMKFNDIDRIQRSYSKEYGDKEIYLIERIRLQADDEGDDPEFIDSLNRSLFEGCFKILIVGEGIRENAAELTEYLQKPPHLRFSLFLVELSCYPLEKDQNYPFLIIPQIAFKTTEIERAVVTIRMSEEAKEKVSTQVAIPESTQSGTRPTQLEESDFYVKLSSNLGPENTDKIRTFVKEMESDFNIESAYGTSSLMLNFDNPLNDNYCKIISFRANGKIVRRRKTAFLDNKIPPDLADYFIQEMSHLSKITFPEH